MENKLNENILDRFYFEQYKIQLKFNRDFLFDSFHGIVVNGLMCEALNIEQLSKLCAIYPYESGKVHYKKGTKYNFGITAFGKREKFEEILCYGLKKVSKMKEKNGTLNGCFELIRTEKYQTSAFGETFLDEIPDNNITIYFATPTRLLMKGNGNGYVDASSIDASRFFELLYTRLANGVFNLNHIEKDMPPIPACKIIKQNLNWVDIPYKKKKMTLGGVVGNLQLKVNMNDFWKRLLWLGQFIHIGNNSAKGLGKYFIY